jgi:hypothetical protein
MDLLSVHLVVQQLLDQGGHLVRLLPAGPGCRYLKVDCTDLRIKYLQYLLLQNALGLLVSFY